MLTSKCNITLLSFQYKVFFIVGLMFNVVTLADQGWFLTTRTNVSEMFYGLSDLFERKKYNKVTQTITSIPGTLETVDAIKPVIDMKKSDIQSAAFWNKKYVIGGIAVAAMTVSAIIYWYFTVSWLHAVDLLVIKAQLNPNAILADLKKLLNAWDGFGQQQQIIQYVEENIVLTPELKILLALYQH